jgi:hypothetical protein
MRLIPRFVSLIACVALSSALAGASVACGGGAPACCAKSASACAVAPATVTTAAVELPGLPSLIPSLAGEPLVSGLRAFIDPETGLLTSTTGFQPAVDAFAPTVDVANLPQIQLPDGSFMIDTSGIMTDNVVVQVDALGHRTFQCTPDTRHLPAPAILPTRTQYAER